jgi:hypothetical protein
MTNLTEHNRIDPNKIGAPFQLLAATLVFLIALDTSFLGAADVLERPRWASAVLVVAAVLNVPLLLTGTFVLQTRFRSHLLSDEHFVQWGIMQLKQTNDAAGVALAPPGPTDSEVSLEPSQERELTRYGDEVERALRDPVRRMSLSTHTVASASRELARAAAARGDWNAAAAHFETAAELAPDDSEVLLALSAAYANTGGGEALDRRALELLDRAIDLGVHGDHARMVRLRSYRGGLLKRLGRTDVAVQVLREALAEAPSPSYEANDIAYNLAGAHALRGERDLALQALRSITDDDFLLAVDRHREDYFSALAGDEAFETLLDDARVRSDLLRDAPS